ncbi:hypothetical protein [Sulfitobacter guttiformis]|uniref:Uncharacterized protein n=1 Tax=Sulfitobacter guttiformis TaxID=74349 RepID=A0A420DJ61_9RHOB|nr:hypothetical protein [Sulfitobacter guttiformis]KIN71905.1 hypothetical protein Z949_1071 [Sulfitobacter guttiformis KCTC 32187]RKE94286.1 hypothetical protein C8N30_3407 [Sulfitobacter guttiformis]
MAFSIKEMGQDPVYERFLGATVGEDSRETNVSVLSMLARLDIDPWLEAAKLAEMSGGAARKRLDALIARFTDVQTPASGRGKVVSNLLDLLPKT